MRIALQDWIVALCVSGLGTGGLFISAKAQESLAWRQEQGWRSAGLKVVSSGQAGFESVPSEVTGIGMISFLSDQAAEKSRYLENGAGLAAGDVDGDGRCDLYFCVLEGSNRLYRNLGGWKFEDITEKAGVGCENQFSTGSVLADVDGDGDLDLLVNGMGTGTRLFRNNGAARFVEVTEEAGLIQRFGSHSMALSDVDQDGDLDLYVANYRERTIKDDDPSTDYRIRQVGGKWEVGEQYQGHLQLMEVGGGMSLVEFGQPDFLYLNEGNGVFKPVSWTDGRFFDEQGKALTEPPRDWGLAVMMRDMTGDGLPDIYVCNDHFSPDRFWINQGKGVFRAAPRLALRKTTFASMSVDVADIDRDGWDDFFVVGMASREHFFHHVRRGNLELEPVPWWGWPAMEGIKEDRPQVMRNTLQWNRGDGTYAEVAQMAGVHATDWSWGSHFLDVDLDGFEDLLVVNGYGHDLNHSDAAMEANAYAMRFPPRERPNILLRLPKLKARNVAYRNLGNRHFEEKSAEWGFDEEGISIALVTADLDGDGDLDGIIQNHNGKPTLLKNRTDRPRIAVRLKGRGGNTSGIGARMEVQGMAGGVQRLEMISGGRYLGGDEALRVFAADKLTPQARLKVTWPSGRISEISDLEVNRLYEIEEPQGAARRARRTSEESASLFENVGYHLKHRHQSDPTTMVMEPQFSLRTWAVDRPGVGLAWTDVNEDGREDLLIGESRGRPLSVFFNRGAGEPFQKLTAPALSTPSTGDQVMILPWAWKRGEGVWWIGERVSASEDPGWRSLKEFRVSIQGVQGPSPVISSSFPVHSMALGAMGGFGNLVGWVGFGGWADRWPGGFGSTGIKPRQAGVWDSLEEIAAWKDLDRIHSGIFSDLDGDGNAEWIGVGEGMPVRVFRYDKDQWKDIGESLGFGARQGRWNAVACGDFNGDGKMDLVTTNWGLNHRHAIVGSGRVRLYYGEPDVRSGRSVVLEAYWDESQGLWLPIQDYKTITSAYPEVQGKYPTYGDYARADFGTIHGDRLKSMRWIEINEWRSLVWMNRGNQFEALELPWEAQVSPAFGVAVADFNGDGREDLICTQNFFGTNMEVGRMDAGVGLWLRGEGNGAFQAIRPKDSGIAAYGEQRAVALADFDEDRRVDLAIQQWNEETLLYKNVGGRPGIKVRLMGAAGNPLAVGAVVRMQYADGMGPAREVGMGSGWKSVHSLAQVLGIDWKRELTGIFIRWPGGEEQTVELGSKVKEVVVEYRGRILKNE